jgi:hypothetical protein
MEASGLYLAFLQSEFHIPVCEVDLDFVEEKKSLPLFWNLYTLGADKI